MGEDNATIIMETGGTTYAGEIPAMPVPRNITRDRLAGRNTRIMEPQPITTPYTLDNEGDMLVIVNTDLNYPDSFGLRIGSTYCEGRFFHLNQRQLRKLRTIINQYLGDDDAK